MVNKEPIDIIMKYAYYIDKTYNRTGSNDIDEILYKIIPFF